MHPSYASRVNALFRKVLKDPLIRGFILTTALLLGVGLEQSLIFSLPSDSMMEWFLAGNLAGLVLGILVWQRLYPQSLIPLYTWQIAGLLVAASAWKTMPWLFFLQGLTLGTLLIHLYFLAKEFDFHIIATKVCLGIGIGNLLLMALRAVPKPLGLVWLAVALAGWRIKRPAADPSGSQEKWKNIRTISWFWTFFLCFYCLGGLYFSCLAKSAHQSNQVVLSVVTLGTYLLGLVAVAILSRHYIRLFPFLATAIMGISLLLQLPQRPWFLTQLSLMDLSFGIMDCFSVAFIFAFSPNIIQATIGLSIFPASIIIGLGANRHCSSNQSTGCIWALALLFIGLIPLYYISVSSWRLKKGCKGTVPALPAPSKTEAVSLSQQSHENVHDVKDTSYYLPKEHGLSTLSRKLGLSPREQQVLQGLASGMKLKDIAEELEVATGTVKTLSSRIYEKAGVKNKKKLLEMIEKWNLHQSR